MNITKLLKTATQDVLRSPELAACEYENQLRGLFIAALYQQAESRNLVCLVEDKHDDERLPATRRRKLRDLTLVARDRLNVPLAIGEFKFYPAKESGLNYQNPIGARLSDIHYLQNLAYEQQIPAFFLDVVLQPKLVGKKSYASLRDFHLEVAQQVFGEGASLATISKKTYFQAAKDRTPRAEKRELWENYLFPCIDMDPVIKGKKRHLRGPVLVRKPSKETGFIAVGVRHSHRQANAANHLAPYLALPLGAAGAVCFIVYDAHGNIEISTAALM